LQKLIITNQRGESITLGSKAPYFLETLDGASELKVTIESQKSPGRMALAISEIRWRKGK
jgi:hypothetical protein